MASNGRVSLKLPPQGALQQIGPDDPLPYYYRPVVGKLYCDRINRGLAYLPQQNDAILEVGYGSGLLMPTLADHTRQIFGVDIHRKNEEVGAALKRLGVSATLISADARRLPFPDSSFDTVIAFSFMEHVKPLNPFLSEMWRVLRPGGRVILGMPMVNKWFNALFPLIGCDNIQDLHITSPKDVRQELGHMNLAFTESGMPSWAPRGLRLYTTFYLAKPVG